MKRENAFQAHIIKRLKKEFPGCIVLKNDANYIQGIPDLIVLHNGTWAALEVKRRVDAPYQPNQEYYVNRMHDMSYAAFVFPENEEEIFYDLQQTLQPSR